MALTLWLVRHGETASNADGIFQGQLDVPLNACGEMQARHAAAALRGISFDAIYASDLSRAASTAEIIAEGRVTGVTLDRTLREMHYGALQGLRYDEAGSALAAYGISDSVRGWRGAPPGGESRRQLRARAGRFLAGLDVTHPAAANEQVLVVAHGGVLRALLTVLLDLPTSVGLRFAFANCGVSRLRRSEGYTVLDFHNRVHGLEG